MKRDDLPQEQPDEEPTAMDTAQRESLLGALAQIIVGMRTEAIRARKASGIEEIWQACEDAYNGMDEANRHEFGGGQWFKPSSANGNINQIKRKKNSRSTAYVRLTSRYVDMGAAKISEITLPIDDKAFTFEPTPVPELIQASKDNTQLMQHPVTGQSGAVVRPAMDGEPTQDGTVPATVGDLAKVQMAKASECAKKAEKRVYDWMSEAKYPLEMRKVEHGAAKLGVGILKCPYPQVKTSWARVAGKMQKKSKIVPGMRAISAWNFYPHGACGENVHDGDYVFESDDITTAKLKKMRLETLDDGTPIYIKDQIDKVLLEGPERCNIDQQGNLINQQGLQKQYKIWYMTGVLTKKDMELLGAVGMNDVLEEDINAIVTLVNDSVIRAVRNPLQSGNFGYRLHCWSRRDGFWAGVGVAEQISMPQKQVTAATRALLNNAGMTAGGQIVVDRNQIEPADKSWELVPNKTWWTRSDGTGIEDIRKAFMSFEFPNMGPQLQAVIDYGFRLAEELSNIPLVTQGKQSENSPQTFGQAEMDNSNAHTLLRSIAYGLDDSITEPVVTDLYEWLLLDEDVPDDEKGDWVINAKGSIAMVEKAIQEMVLAQLIQLSKDPAYGLNPKLTIEKYLRAKRIDPRDVQYTEEELAEIAKRPPPEDPRITAAKIASDTALKVSQGRDQVTTRKSELDVDRDVKYEEALNERARIQEDGKTRELALKRELEIYKENNKLKIELDDAKTELAKTVMELSMQKELAIASNHAKQVASTSMEPVGRAPNGKAFQA